METSEHIDFSERRKLLSRLFRYIFRYRIRIAFGIILSLFTSFANLISIGGFVPIFNALGESGTIKIFSVGRVEKDRLVRYENGEQMPLYESLNAQMTAIKINANSYFSDKTSNESILILCAFLLPVFSFKILCIIGTLYCIGSAGLMAVRDIRHELYQKLYELGIDTFTTHKSGFIMSRIINDVELVGRSLSVEFNDAVNNIFYIVTHLTLLALISWKMLFVTIFIVPILMAPVSKFAGKIRRAAQGQQQRLAEMGGHIQEILSGIRVIRAFSMEGFERNRFNIINNRLFKNTFKGHYYHQVGPALTEFVSTIVVIGFLVWGAYEISEERLSRGLFFAFFFTLIFIMRPLKQIAIMVNLLSVAAVAANRIFNVLDQKPGIKEIQKPYSLRKDFGSIVYDKVYFRYPKQEQNALYDISFTVRQGKTVSLVGSSGAGKSTLLDLLTRFYDVSDGTIKIGNINVKDFNLRNLRTSIGVVTQNIFLFNGTVYDNIACARTDIPAKRIQEVAETANAGEFIEKLPRAYETNIGERGVMLSGGQKQRIAIARALLNDPPILIFDEATSALDNESEMLVQQAMERLLTGRTVFIIAHRLSTIYKSDEIFVIDQGRIIDRGRHEELLGKSTIYRRLYEMQFTDNS